MVLKIPQAPTIPLPEGSLPLEPLLSTHQAGQKGQDFTALGAARPGVGVQVSQLLAPLGDNTETR